VTISRLEKGTRLRIERLPGRTEYVVDDVWSERLRVRTRPAEIVSDRRKVTGRPADKRDDRRVRSQIGPSINRSGLNRSSQNLMNSSPLGESRSCSLPQGGRLFHFLLAGYSGPAAWQTASLKPGPPIRIASLRNRVDATVA
jgi:hypothetical protein